MNKDQIEYWSGGGGRRWLEAEALSAHALRAFGAAAIEAAAPRAGESVLDVGCGTGGTTIELARVVGRQGAVVGIDVSPLLLEAAVGRAAAAGLPAVSFVEADAQAHDLGKARFDLVFSRFGVMFFDDPVEAFQRLRAAAKPGGRIAFVCWQSFSENEWSLVPFRAAAPHLPPMPRPGPEDPGPYSFGDPERVQRILHRSGWRDGRRTAVEQRIELARGGGVEEAVRFAVSLGPAAHALRAAGEAERRQGIEAIRAAFAERLLPGGRIALGGKAWVVTATA